MDTLIMACLAGLLFLAGTLGELVRSGRSPVPRDAPPPGTLAIATRLISEKEA